MHAPTGTLVEVDESAHFTSFRLAALELYPADAPLGFDLDEHKELCRDVVLRAPTRSNAAWPPKGFGFGGVQRERAYHDALRDLATRPWGTRRSFGSRLLTAMAPPPTAATGVTRCLRLLSGGSCRR